MSIIEFGNGDEWLDDNREKGEICLEICEAPISLQSSNKKKKKNYRK